MLTHPQLKSKVDALWDRFWSGGIANPITAIESRAAFRHNDGGQADGTRTPCFLVVNELCTEQMSFIS
jgi:hypothetical protein